MNKPSTSFPWTDKHVADLKRLWGEGKSGTEIAAIFGGISRCAVLGKIHRLHLAKRPKDQRQARPRADRPAKQRPRVNNTGGARKVEAIRIKGKHPIPPPAVIDASFAKPWLQRQFGECAYPIAGDGDETVSCCAPCHGHRYCAGHRKVMFYKPRTTLDGLANVHSPRSAGDLAA